MDRFWLIRTNSGKILGPIKMVKVIDFIKKGQIIGDDEVASGNGFWFSVKEREYVKKYLLNGTPQPFNQITEAVSLFSNDENADLVLDDSPDITLMTNLNNYTILEKGIKLPSSSDLEFPELGIIANEVVEANSSDNNINDSQNLDQNSIEFQEDPLVDSSEIEQMHAGIKKKKLIEDSILDEQDMSNGEDVKLPSNSELEYPDLINDIVEDSLNRVPNVVVEKLNNPSIPSLEDLSFPDKVELSKVKENNVCDIDISVKVPDDPDLEYPDIDKMAVPDNFSKIKNKKDDNIINDSSNDMSIADGSSYKDVSGKIEGIFLKGEKRQGGLSLDMRDLDNTMLDNRATRLDVEINNDKMATENQELISKINRNKDTLSKGHLDKGSKIDESPKQNAPKIRNDRGYLYAILIFLIIAIFLTTIYYRKFVIND